MVSTASCRCRFTLAGSALGAREFGYPQVAKMIFDQALSPERICALFRTSVSKAWKRDAAMIVLAGSIASWKAAPGNWSAEPASSIARELVGADFDRISDQAAKFVAAHWQAISTLAIGAGAAV